MKKEEKKTRIHPKGKERDKKDEPIINTDPFGSYTGIVTDDIYDTPVQDADDL